MIVQNALRLYSQDRTGLVDYALESGGMEKFMSTLLPVYTRAFLACRDKQAGCWLCAPMCLLYNEQAGIKEQKLRLHCPLSYWAVCWPIWEQHFHGLVAQYLKEHFTLTAKMDIHLKKKCCLTLDMSFFPSWNCSQSGVWVLCHELKTLFNCENVFVVLRI